MSEMNRVTAGHGQGGNPFDWIGKKVESRNAAMQQGIMSAAHQKAEHEHDIHKMVTQHVLAKDMHTHITKAAEGGTGISMTYGNIETNITKKTKKPRTESFTEGTSAPAPTAPEEHVETPASTPQAAEAESAPRAEHHTVNIGNEIPTNPGEWKGGYMEHNPKTGRAQTKPGYKEFKTRKQHFEAGVAAQTAAQQGQHFTTKPGIKIPNYARKAMAKRGQA